MTENKNRLVCKMNKKQEIKEKIKALNEELYNIERKEVMASVDYNPSDHPLQPYYYVDIVGNVEKSYPHDGQHGVSNNIGANTYPTVEQAETAARLLYRAKAIIRACLLVEPDIVLNWKGGDLYYFEWSESLDGWGYYSVDECDHGPSVSSPEAALKVIELLDKWGIE